MAERSWTWGARRADNIGYVQERCTQEGQIIYEKVYQMPPYMVPIFIEARRRCIAMEMEEKGNNFVMETPPEEKEIIDALDPKGRLPPH